MRKMRKMRIILSALTISASIACTCFGTETSGSLWSGDNLYQFGTVNGNTYENEMLGYGVELPPDWIFEDEESIAETNQFGEDAMSEELIEQIKEAGNILDMSAANSLGTQNINVQFLNIPNVYGEGFAMLITPEAVIDVMIPELESSLEISGYEISSIKKAEYTISGESITGIKVIGTMYGMDVYQDMLVTKPNNLYLAMITITSFGNDNGDEIISRFYKL